MTQEDHTIDLDLPAQPAGRSRLRELDLRNTWQITAGAILLPLGIALIIIAWHGAAYANVDQKQIPYLVSGGIGGLAVVMIGCFFYWAHWLYRIYDQADLHHQEAMREQRELIRVLTGVLASSGTRVDIAHEAADAVGLSLNGIRPSRTFLATPTGTNFHAAGCPMVVNRSSNLRTVTEDEIGGMKPCRVCDPLVSTG